MVLDIEFFVKLCLTVKLQSGEVAVHYNAHLAGKGLKKDCRFVLPYLRFARRHQNTVQKVTFEAFPSLTVPFFDRRIENHSEFDTKRIGRAFQIRSRSVFQKRNMRF